MNTFYCIFEDKEFIDQFVLKKWLEPALDVQGSEPTNIVALKGYPRFPNPSSYNNISN